MKIVGTHHGLTQQHLFSLHILFISSFLGKQHVRRLWVFFLLFFRFLCVLFFASVFLCMHACMVRFFFLTFCFCFILLAYSERSFRLCFSGFFFCF
ncbi:hypothetical protein FN846DRAFT_271920 [Sphaerosporella brunnea]|uniref:Uncharacterized protein n=1 Tax=Sphaerosporella brunnea TaxID=1250544 RepID=A0A5J5ENU6_9PEZI|nr:hypothetical protein FN846DRAFT_271920 [Sphaerosporella brunnea]